MSLVNPSEELLRLEQDSKREFQALVAARDILKTPETKAIFQDAMDYWNNCYWGTKRGNPAPVKPDYADTASTELFEKVLAAQEAVIAHSNKGTRDPTYFRLNVWGMGKYRDVMEKLGMMYLGRYTTPSFAAYPGDEHFAGDYTEPITDEGRKWREHQDMCLHYSPPEAEGLLPGHKFGSNDGWHVTTDECAAALRVAAAHGWDADNPPSEEMKKVSGPFNEMGVPDADENTYWWAWLGFLKNARDNAEGFQVY